MVHHIQIFIVSLIFAAYVLAAPVDKSKTPAVEVEKKSESEEVDDFGLEYGRYLQQVVQALEEDKDFAKKLENVSSSQLKSGEIAHQLDFVKHSIRSKLDELKRIEVDRLRKLVQEQMERSELGLYRDEDGRLLPSEDGRRWRTIPGLRPQDIKAMNRKGVKLPDHLDIENPHSFEIDDLKKLIQSATKDLEELDKQRREEFKKYEMEKELQYREGLKNMTEEEKKKTEVHHEELVQKHKDHPKIHHPGSKPQLEQVWEDQDHMPKDEFNPKTFFAMHDVNGDGHLDEKEVEALLLPEVRKMYDPKNEEDDPAEMEEEYHRMREHIFNETDNNKDGLISLEEFLKMTQEQEFERDEGWKGLDEQQIYSEADFEEYMRQRQLEMQNPYYGDPRGYYDVPHGQNQDMPPHINYQQGMPQQHPGGYQQPMYQGVPPPQYHDPNGIPQQQYHAGVPPQQQHQGIPPQQRQGAQPQHQVPPQQQQYQGVPPQQHQGIPQQQQHQGIPQQQNIPQQQQHQGAPPNQQAQFQIPPNQQPQFQVPQHQPYQVPPNHQLKVPQQVPQQPQFQGIPQQQQPSPLDHQAIPQQNYQIPQKSNKLPETNEIPHETVAKDTGAQMPKKV